jgi:hypothetical protein
MRFTGSRGPRAGILRLLADAKSAEDLAEQIIGGKFARDR